jgi:hypothetical protein
MPSFSGVIRRFVMPLALVGVATSAASQTRLSGPATLKLDEIPWPTAQAGGAGTSGASGIQTVVLKGDPTKPGLYVLALRVAPNITIQAHSHKDDRVATVLKGTWYCRLRTEVRREGTEAAAGRKLVHRASRDRALRPNAR